MRAAWRGLRVGGTLLLSVPVGPDVVVWNLHRRYGARRLPLRLHGWEVAARYGWDEALLDAEGNWRQTTSRSSRSSAPKPASCRRRPRRRRRRRPRTTGIVA